ncbi:putative e3 ubiquitin ligase, partial [Globisporangium splendens]
MAGRQQRNSAPSDAQDEAPPAGEGGDESAAAEAPAATTEPQNCAAAHSDAGGDSEAAQDTVETDDGTRPLVQREIAAFLDAFERATVSEAASSPPSTVSLGSSEASTSIERESSTGNMLSWHLSYQRVGSDSSRKSGVERLSVDSIELQKASDVCVLLLELQQTLRYRSVFRSEEERTKWWWLVHQLKQQRQRYPEKWDGMADVHLGQIEAAIANLPVAGDALATPASGDHHHHSRRSESSTSSSAAYELRISVGDIPMLESNSSRARHQQQSMSVADSEEDTSWANLTRIVRAASERTVRALMGTPNRDNELFLTGNSSGSGARSRSGSNSVDTRDSVPTLQRSSSSLSVPNMLRSVVGYLGLSMEETFLCQICFENVSISKSFKLTKCGHRFCEACLQNYLQFKVGEGQVYPTCFHEKEGEPACADEIIPDDIQAVITASFWEKYLRFKFNKEHENARQCPRCDHSQVYLGSEHPECVCDNCGEEFCFVHSIAHRGRSCAEYEKKMVAIEKLNHAMINEISKPCPGCNNFVEKIVVEHSRLPWESNGRGGAAVERAGVADERVARHVFPRVWSAGVCARSRVQRSLLLLRAVHQDIRHDVPECVHDVHVRVGVSAARAVCVGISARVRAVPLLCVLVRPADALEGGLVRPDPRGRRQHAGNAGRHFAQQRIHLSRHHGTIGFLLIVNHTLEKPTRRSPRNAPTLLRLRRLRPPECSTTATASPPATRHRRTPPSRGTQRYAPRARAAALRNSVIDF